MFEALSLHTIFLAGKRVSTRATRSACEICNSSDSERSVTSNCDTDCTAPCPRHPETLSFLRRTSSEQRLEPAQVSSCDRVLYQRQQCSSSESSTCSSSSSATSCPSSASGSSRSSLVSNSIRLHIMQNSCSPGTRKLHKALSGGGERGERERHSVDSPMSVTRCISFIAGEASPLCIDLSKQQEHDLGSEEDDDNDEHGDSLEDQHGGGIGSLIASRLTHCRAPRPRAASMHQDERHPRLDADLPNVAFNTYMPRPRRSYSVSHVSSLCPVAEQGLE
eukprot:scpid75464/ scgid19230/ 